MMEENLKEYELIVSQGNRSFWMRLVAASFFTAMLFKLYEIGLLFYNFDIDEKLVKIIPHDIKFAALYFAGGISFAITKNIFIDIDQNILISRFCVGPFTKDVKSKIPQLEYVSVFFDSKELYEINLWYEGNKHYKMYFFEDKEPAMKFAELTARKLNIDLLDATEKGNSMWIDLPKS